MVDTSHPATHVTKQTKPSGTSGAPGKRKKPTGAPKAVPAVDYREILLPALILTAICATATLLLALTNLLTTAKIAANASAKAAQSRMQVLSAYEYVKLDDEGRVYEARNSEGHQLGVVVTTQAKGYGGTIEVMTGVRSDGSVSGVTILSMSETPGLGAKTKESNFLSHYIGARDPHLAVDKDGGSVQAVSGATISSRAVTEAVNSAIAIAAGYLDAAYAPQ